MTLTEEQRAAIEEAANICHEVTAFDVAAVLRTMIDSSEHFTDASKMPGFDLEKAREAANTYASKKWYVDRDYWAHLCAEQLPFLIAEIKRLRAELTTANVELIAAGEMVRAKDARIKELEADLEQAEICIQARLDVIDQQAAKIRELEENCIYDPEDGKIFVPDGHPEIERLRARVVALEDALVEYLAADIAYAAGVLWSRLGPRKEEYRERARQQLQAGGKIGTGARPPCWQITEDRVTAIDQGLRFLEWSNAINGSVETKKHIATLQTMLEETGDKNGFEGRNKMRIETIR